MTLQTDDIDGGAPKSLAGALRLMHAAAFAAGSRVPNVDVDERNVGVSSAAAAVAVLRTSADHGDRYWCAFVAEEAIRHPPWWPAAAMADAHARTGRGPLSVPTYDQIIVGSGATGIGGYIDQVGGRAVNTELTIARARAGSSCGQWLSGVARMLPLTTGRYLFHVAPASQECLCDAAYHARRHWWLADSEWHVVFDASFFTPLSFTLFIIYCA